MCSGFSPLKFLTCVASLCVYSQVYGEYRASLAFDLVSSRQKNVSEIVSDNNHSRMAGKDQKLVWRYSFWIFVTFFWHCILFKSSMKCYTCSTPPDVVRIAAHLQIELN